MGCDVRAAIERRIDGRWTALAPLQLERNYDLFAILAGVRGDHAPIAPPRGLPIDLDPQSCTRPWHKDTLHPYYDGCGCPGATEDLGDHSHSWLTLAELRAYDWNQHLPCGWVRRPPGSVTARELCADFCEWLDSVSHLPGDEIRLVIGFSS